MGYQIINIDALPQGGGAEFLYTEASFQGIKTCILSRKKRSASLCLIQDTACLGLVHGDDPERCYGEGGGRGVHVWEHM